MIRRIRHRGLKRMYERGDPSRVGPGMADRVALALADLDDARKPSDLDLPGYRLHPLKGDLKGYWSISISGNWRMIFRFEDGDVYDVDLVDYH
ncbi:MAG: peptidase [Rhodospirillaceae bacterium]|nr:peptidase [Rhodospirillaceae bacterium]MYH37433.1 peptidase [Rhodospirillaceae bacterium]MYK16165.1 peptidase [Rhodospirillaceae bacterium]MYK59662.1 peptidase [Rhodospirillaceae bacterium]